MPIISVCSDGGEPEESVADRVLFCSSSHFTKSMRARVKSLVRSPLHCCTRSSVSGVSSVNFVWEKGVGEEEREEVREREGEKE